MATNSFTKKMSIYMLYELYQRVVIGIGMVVFIVFLLLGFVLADKFKFEGFLLAFVQIIVGWLGLGLFFTFYALSQHNQPDPSNKK